MKTNKDRELLKSLTKEEAHCILHTTGLGYNSKSHRNYWFATQDNEHFIKLINKGLAFESDMGMGEHGRAGFVYIMTDKGMAFARRYYKLLRSIETEKRQIDQPILSS